MNTCFFVSDLHGSLSRYKKLFHLIEQELPSAIFLGGDLCPSGLMSASSSSLSSADFIESYLKKGFRDLKEKLKGNYPRVFLILGNDDCKKDEPLFKLGEEEQLWDYVHFKKVFFEEYEIYGYSYVPPTPFLLKDWERYDVSRYVDPGCVHPNEGYHTTDVIKDDLICDTIQEDLKILSADAHYLKSIFLFHTPPYQSKLDRAALDGKFYEHVPLDVHVGSIAVQRFIENKKPWITLHGHIHESARITGSWSEMIGNTHAFSAAHDGRELALVRFNPEYPERATRELV